jgi:hypothetical protein
MNYFDLPQPALVIAPSRSGATFLCHCLDSHFQIACERSEPFGELFYWHHLGINHRDLAIALWQRIGYRASMFKLSYRQLRNGYITTETIKEFNPKIIHLHRLNIFEAIVSATLNTLVRDGKLDHPMHTYEPVEQQSIKINCNTLLADIEGYAYRVTRMQQALDALDTIEVTYEEITSDGMTLPEKVAGRICDFLGVNNDMVMFSELTRLNYAPEIVNIEKVKKVLAGTGHEWMLE